MAAIPNEESLADDVRNTVPQNEDPVFISSGINLVLMTIQTYGWLIVGVFVLCVYLANKLRPNVERWRSQQQDASFKKSDVNAASIRMEAMQKARQRMQEQLDKQAEDFKVKEAEREEKKRLEKLEDYDRMKEGKSKLTKPGDPKSKKSLRDDYSPLMGDGGGSCAWRPARRGPSAGGG